MSDRCSLDILQMLFDLANIVFFLADNCIFASAIVKWHALLLYQTYYRVAKNSSEVNDTYVLPRLLLLSVKVD